MASLFNESAPSQARYLAAAQDRNVSFPCASAQVLESESQVQRTEPEAAPEAALIQAAARGDDRAFYVLYGRYRKITLTRLTRFVGKTAEREDLVQEVFLQLHRALPGFESRSSLSTFLHRITRNVAIDYLRQRSRQRHLDYRAEVPEGAAPRDLDPEKTSCAQEQLGIVLGEWERLGAGKREALYLIVFAGRSLRQAAQLLGTTPAAVKQRVGSARRDLARLR